MPSINEVWEQALQINANLVTVHHDLETLKGCCAEELQALSDQGDTLETIQTTLGDGFANLSSGLIGVQQRQDIANRLSRFQIAQTQTVICLLDKIARHVCDLLNEADRQTRFQSAIASAVGVMRAMQETVHPDAALVQQRAEEARRALEECCPPDEPAPRCVFEPCPQPPPLREQADPDSTSPFHPPTKRRRAGRPG